MTVALSDPELRRAREQLRQAAKTAARKSAKLVRQEAMKNAPRQPEHRHREEHGAAPHLRDSAYVHSDDQGPNEPGYEIGFTAYWAAWQHERTDYKHLHGGGGKYLERALFTTIPDFLETLKAQVEIKFGGR